MLKLKVHDIKYCYVINSCYFIFYFLVKLIVCCNLFFLSSYQDGNEIYISFILFLVFFLGLHEREIIIYSISAGVVSFILLSCTFLLRRYKHRNAKTRPFLNASSLEQIPNDDAISVTGASIEGGDGIYETIDESSIPDILLSRAPINENSGSSSDDNSDPLPNDGYLNPYQPMAQEFVKHEYSTIVDKSDSDSSSSNNGERFSGYLNPYQTIVPDQDKHDYYKVNDEKCLENKCESDFLKQSPNDTYIDAQSYDTPCKITILGENENQCEKLDSSDYKDICEMDTKVRAPGCVEENEISHDENQQACDIELKRCVDEHADSSDKVEKVGHCHEVSELSDTPEATCHFNVIIDKIESDFSLNQL